MKGLFYTLRGAYVLLYVPVNFAYTIVKRFPPRPSQGLIRLRIYSSQRLHANTAIKNNKLKKNEKLEYLRGV